jgi:hypothetical protein
MMGTIELGEELNLSTGWRQMGRKLEALQNGILFGSPLMVVSPFLHTTFPLGSVLCLFLGCSDHWCYWGNLKLSVEEVNTQTLSV